MKNTRGFFSAGIPAAFRRRANGFGCSNFSLQKFCPYLHLLSFPKI
jgi:hypothetical protein